MLSKESVGGFQCRSDLAGTCQPRKDQDREGAAASFVVQDAACVECAQVWALSGKLATRPNLDARTAVVPFAYGPCGKDPSESGRCGVADEVDQAMDVGHGSCRAG
jgi:hypothetical protein